jgi:hypothetical protein
MASLLNNASLLLNPAGSIIAYEEDKILSVLPRNGAGDFTFSGGDGGTRVNQQGYIEITPANLIIYSEDLSNGAWIKSGATITANDATAPNGTLTADKVVFAGSNNFFYQQSSFIGQAICSIYVKGTAGETISLDNTLNFAPLFTLTGEWQQITFTSTTSGVAVQGLALSTYQGSTARTLYVWGGMINIGSTAKPYQPTTDRLNYPRITYQNGRGALLSEPQRTNLTQGSNGLTTNWTNYRGTYTANAISSPDGTVNAPRTVWNNSAPSTVGFFFQNFTFAGSTTYCFSVFLKYYNKPIISVGYVDRSGPFLGGDASFNLVNGTFINVTGNATTGIIEPYQDGWYRCTVVFTTVASPSFNYLSVDSGTVVAGEGFYVYGSQLEIGSFPTSYIPTTTATVTRPQDTTENSSASSVIGQTEGVLYTDFMWNSAKGAGDFLVLTVSNGTTANNIFLDIFNSTAVFGVDSSSSRVVQLQSGTITNGRYKMAGVYKNNDFAFFVDGKLIGTDTAGSVPACSVVDVGLWANGTLPFDGELHTTALFNTRLTNTQLAELTTVRSGSGGNISYYGPYTIHTFTGSATFTPSFNGEVEVLVVAGGGGGGVCYGGGGGAGGVLYTSAYGLSTGTGITVTVGAGGTNQVNVVGNGGPGGNSAFGGLTAIGGGYGGGVCGNIGGNGGSGGGGSGTGGSSVAGGLGIAGQGNNGNSSIFEGGGGGGGAENGGLSVNRQGGNGLPYSITGFSNYYGGGGSGGGGTLLDGGLGGGGKGGIALAAGVADATPYTGGGGGGSIISGTGISGLGGAGIVIVRYLT